MSKERVSWRAIKFITAIGGMAQAGPNRKLS
jgi:hypothetical protein